MAGSSRLGKGLGASIEQGHLTQALRTVHGGDVELKRRGPRGGNNKIKSRGREAWDVWKVGLGQREAPREVVWGHWSALKHGVLWRGLGSQSGLLLSQAFWPVV